MNTFERKVYKIILGPVYSYDNEKENWRILNNKEIYTIVKKKPHYNRDNNVKQIMLVWAGTENGRKQNSQKSIIYELGNNKTEKQMKKTDGKMK